MELSLQAVYDRAPILIQHLMTTVSGLVRNHSRYGSQYKEHRAWLEKFDSLSIDQKIAFQEQAVLELVRFARAESSYYSRAISDQQVQDLSVTGDLSNLPYLEKETLRSEIDNIVTSIGPSVEASTGGTTGKSLIVRMTHDDTMKRMAMLDHFKSRVGFEHRKMRRATFMGKHIVPPSSTKPVFWRYNHACKQMLYSSFHLSHENLEYYVNSLNKFKPESIDGFFTSMLDVASYIEQEGIELTFTPVAIFPTSETITKSGRETLERVFGAKVYNQYASSEGAPFITECVEGTLHVEHSTGIFENFDPDEFEVAVTSFETHGTPLIRYKIGDAIELGEIVQCACGIESQEAVSILGRNDDYLVRADGSKINNANLSNLFKRMPNSLIAAQLIQENVSTVRVLLEVDSSKYNYKHDSLLREDFVHAFGNKTRLLIEHVDSIPREKSGKRRFVKNQLIR